LLGFTFFENELFFLAVSQPVDAFAGSLEANKWCLAEAAA